LIGVVLVREINPKDKPSIDYFILAAVDVDRISRDMDFQALQDNLEQITLCNIDTEIVSIYFKNKNSDFIEKNKGYTSYGSKFY
jgi:hypothetical protein